MNMYTKIEFDNAKYKDILTLKCDECGKEIHRTKHKILRRIWDGCKKTYCTNKCHGISRIFKTNHPCLICGKPTKSKFCSSNCSAKYSNKHRKQTKVITCTICNKQVTVSYQKKNQTCGECDNNIKTTAKIKHVRLRKCKVCGVKACVSKICRSLSHGILTVKKLGFDVSAIGTPQVNNEIDKLRDKLKLEWESKSIFELCYQYDIQPRSMYRLFLNLGLKENNGSKFHSGFWYKTWEDKNVFLRSILELRIAKDLDNQKVRYDVEKIRIPYINSRGIQKTYMPDFYIIDKNLLIEAKGKHFYDSDCKLKAEAARNLGFEYKFILDGKEISI